MTPLHRFTSKDGLRVATVRKTEAKYRPYLLAHRSDRPGFEDFWISTYATEARAIEKAKEYCGLESKEVKQ